MSQTETVCNCRLASSDIYENLIPRKELPEIVKTLQRENWTWHREKYISTVNSDAYIYDNTVIFHPTFSFGTAACRGQKRLTAKTIAYWEIVIPYVYGTSMMFGIGDINAKTFSPIYFENLIGGHDNHSLGLSHKGVIFHNGHSAEFTNAFIERDYAVVGVLFNGPEKTLSYYVNDQPLGVAFRDIDTTHTFYPMVSSTAQKSIFTVSNQYGNLNAERGQPSSLMDICIKNLLNVTDAATLCNILPSRMSTLIENVMLKTNNHHKVFAEEFGIDEPMDCSQRANGTCVDCGRSLESSCMSR
uniref:B30.2/SPRY domain-containing protein n=1 Tax=Panagrolaimus sp. JU765 TaxID=591449 RepID=A0AC34RIG3_9BILA